MLLHDKRMVGSLSPWQLKRTRVWMSDTLCCLQCCSEPLHLFKISDTRVSASEANALQVQSQASFSLQ